MAVVVPIIADVKGLLAGVGDTEKQLQRLSKNIGKAGASMTKNFTLPIVGLGAASLVAFDQVDSAMDEVAQRTGATGTKLDSLQTTFKAVAATATQGMGDVAIAVSGVSQKLGLTGKPLQDLSTRMLTLARVTNTDVETATTNVTRAMNALGVKAKDGSGFMDMLLKASQKTGIGLDVLTQDLIKFGPAMRQVGLDTTATTALIGQFEQSGVNTSAAMAGLKKALVVLAKNGVKDLPDGLNALITSIKNAKTESGATAKAIEVFGSKAGPDLAVAIRSGKLETGELIKTLQGSKGTLDATAAAVEGPQEKLARLKNQATLAGAAFAEIFLPVLEKLLGPIQSLATLLTNMSPRMKEIVTIVLAVVAAIGPLLIITSKMIGVFTQVVEIVRVLQVATAALNVTLLMNPFVLIAVAVIALIAGLVILYKHSESFREIVDKIADVVKTNLVVAFDWLKQKIDEIWPTIQMLWTKAQPILSLIGQGIELYVTTYVKLVKLYIEAWWTVIQTAWDLMRPVIIAIGGAVKDYIVLEINAVKTAINLAADAFNLIKTAVITVKDAIDKPLGTIKSLIKDSITDAVDFAKKTIDGITGAFSSVISGIKTAWNDTLGGRGFKLPDWVPGIGGNGYTIPKLAAGGIVSSPTIAMIGEAGPEAVVPLSRGGGMGTTINIEINAGVGTDPNELGRVVVNAIKTFERKNGPVFASV